MLPGKLCIGIIEEDNPTKSYFRMRPLIIDAENGYQECDLTDIYPSDGCLRVVPDKNESNHFKLRMRRMARYCVLDLRLHSSENDKIRPNKNFRGEDSERNAYIVYSDVVREPADDMIFEIFPTDAVRDGEWTAAMPQTNRVLLGDGAQTWTVERAADGRLTAAPDGKTLDEAELRRFEIAVGDTTLSFAIRASSAMESVIGVPRLEEPARPEPVRFEPARFEPAKPEPVKPEPAKPEPVKPVEPREPVKPRKLTEEQLFAAQCGLNPRRSRSLQEIIDEKWRHSRVDQLGHPVPPQATGMPIQNPVDAAMDALNAVWQNPALHEDLVNRIGDMQAFVMALEARRTDSLNGAIRTEMENLEAERLMAIDELAALRKQKESLRDTLKAEIRAEEAEALRDVTEKADAARAELAELRAQLDVAHHDVEIANDAFASLDDGRFENKLRDFALTSRAAKLISGEKPCCAPAQTPEAESPDRDAWIGRVMTAFADAGLPITKIDAANYLICMALGDAIILSGAAAADKGETARAIANAVGACAANRYREITRPREPELAADDLTAVAVIRDANMRPHEDIYRGLYGANESCTLIAAVSDNGCGMSLNAETLERGFMIRVNPVPVDAPWRAEAAEHRFAPAKRSALKSAFLRDDARLSADVELRLRNLRAAFGKHNVYLSRHTLNMMYRFCAAMVDTGLMDGAAALDLAFAQKALPAIIAEAPIACLGELREILSGMPRCRQLLTTPSPLQ